jgi:hypothetical protein
MKRARSANARDLAARWVRENGDEEALTDASTMCWFPRFPWRLRYTDGQYSGTLRCADCPGCRTHDQRSEAKRLYARYRDDPRRFTLLKFQVASELQRPYLRMVRRLKGAQVESQLFRYGADWAGLLTTTPALLREVFERRGVKVSTVPIINQKYRSSWDFVTSGMLIPRANYGANVKRIYGRGLGPRPKQSWLITRVSTYAHFNRSTSPRAFAADGCRLVPPRFWSFKKIAVAAVRQVERFARSVETALGIDSRIMALLPTATKDINVVASGKRLVADPQQAELHLQMLRERRATTAESAPVSESVKPHLVGALHKIDPVDSPPTPLQQPGTGERAPPGPVVEDWMREQMEIDKVRGQLEDRNRRVLRRTYRDAMDSLYAKWKERGRDGEGE